MCKSPSFAGEMPHSPRSPFLQETGKITYREWLPPAQSMYLEFPAEFPTLPETNSEGKLTPFQMESLQKKRSVS